MLQMLFEGADEERVIHAASQAAEAAGKCGTGEGAQGDPGAAFDLLGPSPAAITRIKDLYRYVLYIKSSSIGQLHLLRDAVANELEDAECMNNIYLNSDIDPLNIV